MVLMKWLTQFVKCFVVCAVFVNILLECLKEFYTARKFEIHKFIKLKRGKLKKINFCRLIDENYGLTVLHKLSLAQNRHDVKVI